MIRHGMIKWLRSLLYRKSEETPDEVAGLEATRQHRDQAITKRAEQGMLGRREGSRDSGKQ
jgi:hypothetical protein